MLRSVQLAVDSLHADHDAQFSKVFASSHNEVAPDTPLILELSSTINALNLRNSCTSQERQVALL